ncbi:MAG: TIGR03086 family metal-binding protein [Actinomycetota bacterium]|jgi:uncharacterized protein (TIGR03086 family)|nr:TIGR03086 family metal-binding protein [Actinomycetota bacterium]
MDPLAAHERAQQVFADVLAGVGPGQLEAPTPCSEWSVRDLVGHVVSGNYRVAQKEPPAPAHDVAGLLEAHAASARAAQAVLAAPGGLERTYQLRIGEVPGAVVVVMRARDALVHAWDLAKATGQSTDIDPELADWALGTSRQTLTEDMRGPGRPFGAEQPCEAGRPVADRLAAFLGRAVD